MKEQDTYRIHRPVELEAAPAAHWSPNIAPACSDHICHHTVSGLLQTRPRRRGGCDFAGVAPISQPTTFPFGNARGPSTAVHENVDMPTDLPPGSLCPRAAMKTVITVQSGDSDQGGIVAGENASDIACSSPTARRRWP